MNNPIGWFEIYVDDMERAKSFYQQVLAVELTALGDPTGGDVNMWAFPSDMEQYGATGALVKMDGMQGGGNSVMVYFSCDDCAVEESRVVAAGGRVDSGKIPIGEYGFCSMVADTEGNSFGLHSMK